MNRQVFLTPITRLSTGRKLFVARVAATLIRVVSFSRFQGRALEVSRGGIKWSLDLSEGIDLSIFLLGGFEKHTVRRYGALLKQTPSPTVIDVGANSGSHTLPLAQIVSTALSPGTVIAIEPTENAFARLLRNVHLNPALGEHIRCRQAMVASTRNDPLPPALYASWPLGVRSREKLHPIHQGARHSTKGAHVITLDEIVKVEGLASVDLIKIDVDGNEHSVLAGSSQTIERFRPIFVLEWAPHEIQHNGRALVDHLQALLQVNYRIYDLTTMRPLNFGVKDLERLAPYSGSINIAVVPHERRGTLAST